MSLRRGESPDPDPERAVIDNHILQAIRGIRYGSVEITIHDSKIVQIERKEKVRFDRCSMPEAR